MTLEPVTPKDLGLPDQGDLQHFLGTKIWHAVGTHVEKNLVEPAREIAARPSKHFRAKLVYSGYQLLSPLTSSADQKKLDHLAKAIELLHTGSLIIDDIQDQSPMRRGGASLHCLKGVPGALCTGNWLYFRPVRLIEELGLPPILENQAFRYYHEALELAHYGQALDLNLKIDRLGVDEIPDICDAVSELKTGAITALAMTLGAMIAGASVETAQSIGRFGRKFGTALQKCDDIGSLTSPKSDPTKKYEDLLQRKPSGVWSLAISLNPESFASFRKAALDIAKSPQEIETWLKDHDFARRSFAYIKDQLADEFDTLSLISEIRKEALSELKQIGDKLIHAYS